MQPVFITFTLNVIVNIRSFIVSIGNVTIVLISVISVEIRKATSDMQKVETLPPAYFQVKISAKWD